MLKVLLSLAALYLVIGLPMHLFVEHIFKDD